MIGQYGQFIKTLRKNMEQNKIDKYRKKKDELVRLLEICRLEKINVIAFSEELRYKHLAKEISYEEYKGKLNKTLKNRSVNQWVRYYDDLEKYYENKIKKYDELIEKKKDLIIPGLFLLLIVMMASLGMLLIKPEITGFTIFESQSKSISNITFDRNLDCQSCGTHRAPGLKDINMSIIISVDGIINNATIKDYFNNDWSIVDANNGVVNIINETTSEITWNVEIIDNNITLNYIIQSPQETIPPTKYDFYSETLNETSEAWNVIVTDAKTLSSVAMNAPTSNLTIKPGDIFTITCTPSCSGTGPAPDIVHSYQSCGNIACSTNLKNISTSSTTSDPISVGANPETAACNSAPSDTVTGRNDGSVMIRCHAQQIATATTRTSSPVYNITIDGNSSKWTINSVNKNETTILQNMFVNFSSNWTDNLALDSFIFSIDGGGGFVNSTNYKFGNGLKNGISSNITFITASAGTNVSWKFIVNDSVGNWNETGTDSFLVSNPPDTTVPIYEIKPTINETSILQNMFVNFSTNWTDNVALSSFIFSINYSSTGYKNSSAYAFGGGSNVSSNITFITSAIGTNVSWQFIVNDSNNNFNATKLESFIVDAASQVNRAPIILDISLIPVQSPTEASITNVTFSFIIDDQDGTNNITDSSAFSIFNISSYAPQRAINCGRQSDVNSTTANYSCSILVWYFDPAGNWSVITNITDNQNTSILIEQWNYSELTSIVISPQSLSWQTIAIGSKNQTSNNDPTIINNTGNGNISSVRVNAINLGGLNDGSKFIPVANFTVYNATSSIECNENIGTMLVNATTTAINGVGIYSGNNSASLGKQNLYYCLRDVGAQITSQTYSTNNTGSWTISLI